ncbi:MAG: right-handed parallel beta-helix repeat-containing protein [Ignavibacteriaceae bacterium]
MGGERGWSKNNVLENNKIGTSATGNKLIANNGSGITLLSAFDTQIKNNVISGNGIEYNNLKAGITHGFKSKKTTIENNFIGTNSTGDAHLGNGVGIKINSDSAKISFNTISANIHNGITIGEFGHVTWNSIYYNKIGTDKSGEKELGNGGHGIEVINGSDTELWKNVISGNNKSGIFIGQSSYQNGIFSNNIGTDSTGMKPIGNKEDGITITNSKVNKIWNNLISANKYNGISVSDNTAGDNFLRIDISENKIGTDKNKQNPNNDMGNLNEGITINFAMGSINDNHIGFNKTGLLYKGIDRAGINNAKEIISNNQIYYNKETGLKIFESYPRVINNYIHHNFFGVYIQEKILQSGKLEFKGNDVDDNSGPNSGIHIKNARVSIEGNSISHDAGNAITIETASDVTVNNNNIFANQGYGLNNLVPWFPINGQANWWGDASGPGGSGSGTGNAVSEGVNFSNWLTEMVSLVTSAELDTVIMPLGESDTVNMYFQNWESMLDVIEVQVTDDRAWQQSPASPGPLKTERKTM